MNALQQVPGEWDTDQCRSSPEWSFDTWIFNKSKLKNLKEEDFQRNTSTEDVPFYKSGTGAESTALYALQQSYPFTSLYNACDRINSWHFHLTPKVQEKPKKNTRKLRKNTRKLREHAEDTSSPLPALPTGAITDLPSRNPKCVLEDNCFLK